MTLSVTLSSNSEKATDDRGLLGSLCVSIPYLVSYNSLRANSTSGPLTSFNNNTSLIKVSYKSIP